MKIEFDPVKSEKNTRERGLPFSVMEAFDWVTAEYSEDTRFAYPERRMVAIGYVGVRLHFVCFTQRGDVVRIISFRKANRKEIREYEEAKAAYRR
jgi:uncharacterized DUF497 family protein